MQPYQERVIIEHVELCEKIDKLILFIEEERFNNLDVDDRQLLIQQLDAMKLYRNILLNRINRFKE